MCEKQIPSLRYGMTNKRYGMTNKTALWNDKQNEAATFAGRGSVEVADVLKGDSYRFRFARTPG
jgi:hypothetical protein